LWTISHTYLKFAAGTALTRLPDPGSARHSDLILHLLPEASDAKGYSRPERGPVSPDEREGDKTKADKIMADEIMHSAALRRMFKGS
jgi:hypothetical protein